MGFATETTANLRGGDLQLRYIHTQQLRTVVSVGKMALRCHPELTCTVRANTRKTCVWFNISLVRLSCLITAFYDDIGFSKTLVDITMTKLAFIYQVTVTTILCIARLHNWRIII